MIGLDVNVCKNDRCKNLGISQSPDYEMAPRTLNAPSLFCKACNALQAPMQSNADLIALLSPMVSQYQRSTLTACPRCQGGLRHFGHTAAGTPRYQCRCCRKVFSPPSLRTGTRAQLNRLAELLWQGTSFSRIQQLMGLPATSFYRRLAQLAEQLDQQAWRLEVQKAHPPRRLATASQVIALPHALAETDALALWALNTADVDTGYVWAQTVNYSRQPMSELSRYPGGEVPSPISGDNLIQRTEALTEQFWCRDHFEQLIYTPVAADVLDQGTLLTPMTTAHLHFQWLHQVPHLQQVHHYLCYEIIARSACVTAYHETIKSGKSDIFYVMETLNRGLPRAPSSGIARFSWWNNYWQHRLEEDGRERMLGLLSEHDDWQQQFAKHADASLTTCRRFEHFLAHSPLAERQGGLKPSSYLLLARIFRHLYNFSEGDAFGRTPAMGAGLTDRAWSVGRILDCGVSTQEPAEV